MILLITGCLSKRSITVNYNEDMPRLNNAGTLTNVSLGIAKFEDKRTINNPIDPGSESYVADLISGHKKIPVNIGLTYEGREYIPVNDLIQNIFIKEFTNAGINAKPIAEVIPKQNFSQISTLKENYKFDYIIGGQILGFGFACIETAKFWTTQSDAYRSVEIDIIIVKMNGEKVLINERFSETQHETGITFHTDSVDILMNVVLKKIVKQVIQEAAAKMAINYRDVSWKIVLNGKNFYFNPNPS